MNRWLLGRGDSSVELTGRCPEESRELWEHHTYWSGLLGDAAP